MRIGAVETVLPAAMPDTLPIKLTQTSSKSGALLKAALMVPASLALILPYVMVGQVVAASASGIDGMAAHPLMNGEILTGIALWTLALGFLIVRLGQSLSTLRAVTIDEDAVHINDSGLFRDRAMSVPLNDFSGVAHHVRTSLSGVRHELVLVHPDRAKSVLLSIAPRFAQGEIDRVSALLLCPEISSKSLYGLAVPAPNWTPAPREGNVVTAAA